MRRRTQKKASDVQKISRAELRRKGREEKEVRWFQKMKERGGLTPKRAKKWGDSCNHPECEKWAEEECAYTERETKGCFQLIGEETNVN